MKKVSLILLTVLALATAGRVSAAGQDLKSLFEATGDDSLIGKLNKGLKDIDGKLWDIKDAEKVRDARERKQGRIKRSLKRLSRHIGRHKKKYFIGLPVATIAAACVAYVYGPSASASAYNSLNQWMNSQGQCDIDGYSYLSDGECSAIKSEISPSNLVIGPKLSVELAAERAGVSLKSKPCSQSFYCWY